MSLPSGIALKLLSNRETSPLDIANAHLAHARTHGGEVLYSTDVPISSRYHQLSSVIFYFEGLPGRFVFIHADIVEIMYGGKEGFVPENSAELSPPQYADVPKRTWLRLRNLRRADPAFLGSLKSLRSDGALIPFVQHVAESARANRIYWWIDSDNADDGLIF